MVKEVYPKLFFIFAVWIFTFVWGIKSCNEPQYKLVSIDFISTDFKGLDYAGMSADGDLIHLTAKQYSLLQNQKLPSKKIRIRLSFYSQNREDLIIGSWGLILGLLILFIIYSCYQL